MTPEPDFALTDADKASPLWVRLKAHIEKRRADLRGQNDGITLDPVHTAALRGQITCLSGLLALETKPPQDG